jgi:hypothetical protein
MARLFRRRTGLMVMPLETATAKASRESPTAISKIDIKSRSASFIPLEKTTDLPR